MGYSVYDELIERVEQGEFFKIDFKKRNLKVGKDFLIKDGKWEKKRILYPFLVFNPQPILIDNFRTYKYSRPSKRSESNRKCYFKALDVNELTDEQLVCGENREVARAKLECFLLCMILQDKLQWTDEKLWFWKSEEEPDLIILKEWVLGE